MSQQPLAGMRILVLEDEYLIAFDVEQLCRDHGAEDVIIHRAVRDDLLDGERFDAAIVDLMLSGTSTLDFAKVLRARSIPFVFATGYSGHEAIFQEFPDIPVLGKPYGSEQLVAALASITAASRTSKSGT